MHLSPFFQQDLIKTTRLLPGLSALTAVCLLLLILLPPTPAQADSHLLHYDLAVKITPETHQLAVRATITLPPGYPRNFELALHGGLAPQAAEPEVSLAPAGRAAQQGGRLETFRVSLPPATNTFTLVYGGEIHHPPGFAGRDYARGVRYTPGRIDPEGVYLGPAAFWYPRLPGEHFLSFRLQVKLPPGWTAVSQGRLVGEPRPGTAPMAPGMGAAARQLLEAARQTEHHQVIWEKRQPQEGIFLVADRFTVYQEEGQQATAMVFLRQPDPELARRYLEATAHYLQKYSEMLGPYPYSKFALVENAWESGFGMPSFTLLGSRVIRLPFILHSSYPHEILHNWWGNGVFTDYGTGNWNEGLTAYLADHLLMARQGRGAEYRLGVLQKYADYALGGRDFPLLRFTSRHDPATEAVGYGKGLMFFHMLRHKLGDETFFAGLRHFYRHHLFQTASYADLLASFRAVTDTPGPEEALPGERGQRLDAFFRQWLERDGAPLLAVEQSAVQQQADGSWLLTATFSQRPDAQQAEPPATAHRPPPYRLLLPLAITLEGENEPRRRQVAMEEERLNWQIALPRRPSRLELDPDFDLFRRLDPREIPPAFSRLYGRQDRLLVVLPSQSGPTAPFNQDHEEKMLAAYRELARALQRFGSAGVEVVRDDELAKLPARRGIILLGRHNRFQNQVGEILPQLAAAYQADGSLQIADVIYPADDHAFALALPRPPEAEASLGWIVMDRPEMLPYLLRRLPHYHRYGALVFQGDRAENILRHHWPTPASPLRVDFSVN